MKMRWLSLSAYAIGYALGRVWAVTGWNVAVGWGFGMAQEPFAVGINGAHLVITGREPALQADLVRALAAIPENRRV